MTLLLVLPSLAQEGINRDRRVLRQSEEKRFALVVGNNGYPTMPLKNAVNDARSVAGLLSELEFDVTLLVDSRLPDFERSVARWVSQLAPDSVALFYFSGHGLQVEGVNYLVPIDFSAVDEIDAKYQAYSADRVLEKMQMPGTRMNIVILDACRNNPFRVSRGGARGLAQMSTGVGTFIAYATAPGSTASDNPVGRNGLFTHYLLRALNTPGLRLEDTFKKVREAVYSASRNKQLPWTSSSVIGDFVFRQSESIRPGPQRAESQQVKWGPNLGKEAGICIENCTEFVPWHVLKHEVEQGLLSQLSDVPAGSSVVLDDLQHRRNWIVKVVDPNGGEVAHVWFGTDPHNGWRFDGLVRVGSPRPPIRIFGTFRRYSDGSFRK